MIQVASAKAGLSITASGTAAAAYASLCYTVTIARRRFAAALLPRLFGTNVPGHTTRAPPVGFEPRTNGFQPEFYAMANLDKTSLLLP